jgi:universal stress protein A
VKKVLACVDGSEPSLKAASFAHDLVRAFDAHLTLLHVIEPLAGSPLTTFEEPMPEIYARQMTRATDLLRELASDLRAHDADQVIEMGRPSDVICREAEERGADLIVMGSHGHGPTSRLVLGSVGSRVASMANRSVTIVR